MATRGPRKLVVHPLTPARWDDLVALFTGRGSGQVRWCWCMYYRRSGRADVPPGISVADFNRAGFVEVARRKPTRPVVRKALRRKPA